MRQNRGICLVGAGCGGRKRKSDFHVSDGRICRIWQKSQRLSLSERWISRTDLHAAGIVNFIIAQDARRCIEKGYSSMYQDVKRCIPTEIDAINGAIVEQARRYNVSVPYNSLIVDLIHAIEGAYKYRKG